MYICTYIRMYVRTYVHTYIHTYVHIYIHTHIHTYTHTYVHAYIHIRTYVHIYIHTHTHTYICSVGPTASLNALDLPAIKPQLADYPPFITITTPTVLHCSTLKGKKAKLLHWDLWVTWNKMQKINDCFYEKSVMV